MNRRTQALLLGIAMIIFWPFLLLYLIAYHHFDHKYHIFATLAEYINAVKSNTLYGLTGNSKQKDIFNDSDIDWWMRKGRYIKKYTGLSKAEVLELKDIVLMNFLRFSHYDETVEPKNRYEYKKKAITFTYCGSWYNDYYVFRKDGTYSFVMNNHEYRGDKHGKVDENFLQDIKAWIEAGERR